MPLLVLRGSILQLFHGSGTHWHQADTYFVSDFLTEQYTMHATRLVQFVSETLNRSFSTVRTITRTEVYRLILIGSLLPSFVSLREHVSSGAASPCAVWRFDDNVYNQHVKCESLITIVVVCRLTLKERANLSNQSVSKSL